MYTLNYSIEYYVDTGENFIMRLYIMFVYYNF